MFALLSILIVLALVSSAVRRLGLAGCLAMFAAFVVAFGRGPPLGDDWSAAAAVAIIVFVAVRVAQSQGSSHEPGCVAMARDRLAGRAVHRRPEAWSRPPANYGADGGEAESDWLGEEVAYERATARRRGCERRG